MSEYVTRAEFLEAMRQIREERNRAPGQRFMIGGGNNGDIDPGVFFPTSPQPSGSNVNAAPAMRGIVLPLSGPHAGTISLTDGTDTSPIITEATLDIDAIGAVLLGTWTIDEIIAAIDGQVGSACAAFSWNDNSGYYLRDVGTSYAAYDNGTGGWCLTGSDQLPFAPASAHMVIRYTAVDSGAGSETWALHVYDVSATAPGSVVEITGLVAGANVTDETAVLLSWPTTSTSLITIQVKHSSGAAGNSFQLHSLQLIVKGAP